MPSNEILPFCPNGAVEDGALLPLDEYVQDAHRLNGMQSGIARRTLFNRVLRQTSHMAAALAAFIVTHADRDVLDDGGLDKLAADLATAVGVAGGRELAEEAKAIADALQVLFAAHEADLKAHGASAPADAHTIALRGDEGTLQVGAPTEGSHAATKKYVDRLVETIASGESGGLVIDAPDDGFVYGRKNNEWAVMEAIRQDVLSGRVGSADATLPAGREKDLALVPELGLFRFYPDSTLPVDGEFCIAAADNAGRWELIAPSVETMLSLLEPGPDQEPGMVTEYIQVSLSFGALAAGASLTVPMETITAGPKTQLTVTPPTLPASIAYSAYVNAAGAVVVRATNVGTASVTLAAQTWGVAVTRER